MHLNLDADDLKYGGITVGAFLPVAVIGYPIAISMRHSELLRDTLPLRCVAMHFAGWCFVMHDWLNWHNSDSACPLLSVLEAGAACAFFCTLLWKHHMFYIRHVADRADHRFTLIAVVGCVAFVTIGLIRLFYDLFEHRCLRLDAAVAAVGSVQLIAGAYLFRCVGRFPGAHSLLHLAIRFELAVGAIAVITGLVKQWVTNSNVVIALLAVMSVAFNASFVLYIAPLFPCCKRRAMMGLESIDDSGLLGDVGGGIQSSYSVYDSQSRSTGGGGRNGGTGGPSSRSSTNNRIADHFQGRLERVVVRLVRKIRSGRSERAVLEELEHHLSLSRLPAKLIVNAREDQTDRTVLHYAAAVGYSTVVARLAEYSGNDLEQTSDVNGYEPLHCVAIGHESVDITAPSRTLTAEDVATMCTARAQIVRVLVTLGARINTPVGDGRRPIHFAVQHTASLANLAHLVSPTAGMNTPAILRGGGHHHHQNQHGNSNNDEFPPTPVHLSVVEALLLGGAKLEPALPTNIFGGGPGGDHFQSSQDADRHDLEWHHVVHRGCAARKTPLALAVELDDAPLVALILRFIAKANPGLSHPPNPHAPCPGISGNARRLGLTCTDCNGASLLHIALISGARRVCEAMLTPHVPLAAFGNRPLPLEDATRIANVVWPMLGSRTETQHGHNVFHCAALSGDPALANLLLHALTAANVAVVSPSTSRVSSPAIGGNRGFPSNPATPRGIVSSTTGASLMTPLTAATPLTAPGTPFVGETLTGAIVIIPNARGSPAWAESEGRLQQLIGCEGWRAMQLRDAESFAGTSSRAVSNLAGKGGLAASSSYNATNGGGGGGGGSNGTSPTAAGASSAHGDPTANQNHGAAASVARRDAALRVLKNAGLPSADRLVRSYESRNFDSDDLVMMVDNVRADALNRLKGSETRLDPARAHVDTIIAATVTLLHFQLARMQPFSGNSTSMRQIGGSRRGGSRGRTQQQQQLREPQPAFRPVSPGSTLSGLSNGTNIWSVIVKLLDAKAFEYSAQYGDAMLPQTPLDLAASRGHVEMCRTLAAVRVVAQWHLQPTPLQRQLSLTTPAGGAGAADAPFSATSDPPNSAPGIGGALQQSPPRSSQEMESLMVLPPAGTPNEGGLQPAAAGSSSNAMLQQQSSSFLEVGGSSSHFVKNVGCVQSAIGEGRATGEDAIKSLQQLLSNAAGGSGGVSAGFEGMAIPPPLARIPPMVVRSPLEAPTGAGRSRSTPMARAGSNPNNATDARTAQQQQHQQQRFPPRRRVDNGNGDDDDDLREDGSLGDTRNSLVLTTSGDANASGDRTAASKPHQGGRQTSLHLEPASPGMSQPALSRSAADTEADPRHGETPSAYRLEVEDSQGRCATADHRNSINGTDDDDDDDDEGSPRVSNATAVPLEARHFTTSSADGGVSTTSAISLGSPEESRRRMDSRRTLPPGMSRENLLHATTALPPSSSRSTIAANPSRDAMDDVDDDDDDDAQRREVQQITSPDAPHQREYTAEAV